MAKDRANNTPLNFIDDKTVVLSLDEDLRDYIENRPETGEGLDMESEGKLVDISMALHQLMGLKAN